MPSLSTDKIRKLVDKFEEFVAWVAKAWRERNWVRILSLIFVLLSTFSNPPFLKKFLSLSLPRWYGFVDGLIILLAFLALIVVALRKAPTDKDKPRTFPDVSAIKGLLPFRRNDAELFSRLQRGPKLAECLQAIADNSFHFGVLYGELGCGKSSFLQAGLQAGLVSQGHACVYVELTDQPPLTSIQNAIAEELKIPVAEFEGKDLKGVFEVAAKSTRKSVVLILDQFEQFFSHSPRKSNRELFVGEVARWYAARTTIPVKVVVSLRGDLYYQMGEFYRAMQFSPGLQQTFQLEKFDPEEAAHIFAVIAKSEQIPYDASFLERFTKDELVDRRDGLISPVDIQVLTWVIASQHGTDKRAFNRRAYQRAGGVEGLLERFLRSALATRVATSQREAAVKVLLALSDLDTNTRAGVLTLDALRGKLAGTIASSQLQETLTWLARGDVRLIRQTLRNGSAAYELGHDRLIPALRRIAGKELSHADQANQLLERRVNEWLGDDRPSRLLLTWPELRLVKRQKPYLVWGQQRSLKEELLLASNRRLRRRAIVFALPLVFVLLFFIWLNTSWGQIYQTKRDVVTISRAMKGGRTLVGVVETFALIGDNSRAQAAMAGIDDDFFKSQALLSMAKVAKKTGDANKASVLLRQAAELAEKVSDSRKVELLISVCETSGTVGTTDQTLTLLDRAIQVAKESDDSLDIDKSLREISFATARIALVTKDTPVLRLGERNAEDIDDRAYKRAALKSISWAAAHVASDTKDAAILQDGVQIAENMYDSRDLRDTDAIRIWGALAAAAAKVGDSSKASALFSRAALFESRFQTSENPLERMFAREYLADAAARMGDDQKALSLFSEADQIGRQIPQDVSGGEQEILSGDAASAGVITRNDAFFLQAATIADHITSAEHKARAFRAIADQAAQLGDKKRASEYLTRAAQQAEQIEYPRDKIEAWCRLGRSAIKIDPRQSSVFLQNAIQTSKDLKDPGQILAFLNQIVDVEAELSKATNNLSLLRSAAKSAETARGDTFGLGSLGSLAIANAAATLGDLRFARSMALRNDNDALKVAALCSILVVWDRRNKPTSEQEDNQDNPFSLTANPLRP
jgi:tetratricopeptide (TPR) repeat protein